nr:PREDICTED: glutamate receptor 2.3-like [Daucus carota subsp. sativus]
MAGADSSQLKAIASIFKGFGWKEVIFVYEDTGYQDGLIQYLSDAMREAGIQISMSSAISISANDLQIEEELLKLKSASSRVFLADAAGMMSEGYAWLTTDGLSNTFAFMDATVRDAMQGVLGTRPYVPKSTKVTTFKMRWGRELQCTKPKAELNIFGSWAYDAVWALAMAVERVTPDHNADHKENLGISELGPTLLKELLRTKFKGLSGEFSLVNRQLQISDFEILNVIGNGEQSIGYWNSDRGLSRDPDSLNISSTYSTSVNVLRSIIWPGDSTVKPMYWAVPTSGRRLKVGVPVKDGFTEFAKLQQFQNTTEYNITGFCADVFRELLLNLPFKIENPQYIPYWNLTTGSAGSYDDLLTQLEEKDMNLVGNVYI